MSRRRNPGVCALTAAMILSAIASSGLAASHALTAAFLAMCLGYTSQKSGNRSAGRAACCTRALDLSLSVSVSVSVSVRVTFVTVPRDSRVTVVELALCLRLREAAVGSESLSNCRFDQATGWNVFSSINPTSASRLATSSSSFPCNPSFIASLRQSIFGLSSASSIPARLQHKIATKCHRSSNARMRSFSSSTISV